MSDRVIQLRRTDTLHRIEQTFDVRYSYPVCFTRGAFDVDNVVLRDLMRRPDDRKVRVLVAVDSGVAAGHPACVSSIEKYMAAHADVLELVRAPWIVRGGEISKSDPREVTEFYDFSRELGICRHSYVIAVGGGAMIDAVGYAAATAHRGIRLIRMPTTVLGQNDAGVGVKNAINWHGRKNFLGTFTPPFAVVNDFDFIGSSMPAAERRAGIAEAVKVSLIRDRAFFERLHSRRHALAALEASAMESMIVRCAELHLTHIRTGGDPFERGSARPLDFGHWSAHRMEELSNHALRHGEAVAIGVALDSLYSKQTGMLSDEEFQLIITTLRDIGFALYHPTLETLDIAKALDDFREHLGGDLCITLLRGIGKGVEVNHIDVATMRECIWQLRALAGTH